MNWMLQTTLSNGLQMYFVPYGVHFALVADPYFAMRFSTYEQARLHVEGLIASSLKDELKELCRTLKVMATSQ